MSNDEISLTVLLVRHAEPVAPRTAGFDEFTRPLTAKVATRMNSARNMPRRGSTPHIRVPTCARGKRSSRLRTRAAAIATIEICASGCCRRRVAGLESASQALAGGLRLRGARWRERTNRAGENHAGAGDDRVAALGGHGDSRKPRQSDRAGASRDHAGRRL